MLIFYSILGISPEELIGLVKPGDVIDTVQGESVVALPFTQVIEILVSIKEETRQIGFKRFNLDKKNETPSLFAPSCSPSSTCRQLNYDVQLRPAFSPKEVKRISQAGAYSPGTYAFLTAFESASLTPEKHATRTEHDTQESDFSMTTAASSSSPLVGASIPGTIRKTLKEVASVVGDTAVEAAKAVTGHETVIARKNALLSELAQCCVLLGAAEEKENLFVSETRSLRLKEAELIGRLGDAEFAASEHSAKVLALQLELETTKADRDALQSKFNMIEEEMFSSRLLMESQHTQITEQLKEDLEAKTHSISSLGRQLQAEKADREDECATLKETISKMASEQKLADANYEISSEVFFPFPPHSNSQ